MLKNVTALLNPVKPLVPLSLSKVKFIVLHHVEAEHFTWEQINDYHKNGKKWNAAGYNEYVMKNGDVYILRGDHIGAHAEGYNSCSYGIALEGDYTKTNDVPIEQYHALKERVAFHLTRIRKVNPNVTIVRHKDLNKTTCPANFPFNQFLYDINSIKPDDIYNDAINTLVANKLINSPEYWKQMFISGSMAKGEYVMELIERMATYIKGRG